MKLRKKQEENLKEKGRKISIKEGCAFGVQDGFGLRYVTPYALAVGSNNFHIGILSSVPNLIGTFSQIFTFDAMSKFKRKNIVFFGVILQSIMWLFMIGIGILYFYSQTKEIAPLSLIVIYSLLTLFGAFIGPAWASWMKDLVTENKGNYFGKRNKIIGFVTLASMLLAGFILDYFKKTKIFYGFLILFFLAFVFRGVSAFLLLKQHEPSFKNNKKSYFSFIQFLKKMSSNNFGKFVIFLALINFATMIASPFFTVYMLKNLGFSYVTFIMVSMVSLLTTLVTMPFWGRIIDNYGSIKIMRLSGFFIPLIPLLWLASPLLIDFNFKILVCYLLIIEAFSGFIWAGFNLAANNFIYDAVTRERMSLCVAYSNILSGIFIFLGSALGGFISSFKFSFFGLSSLLFIFLLSGLARFAVYFIMSSRIKEVRKVKKMHLLATRFHIFKLLSKEE